MSIYCQKKDTLYHLLCYKVRICHHDHDNVRIKQSEYSFIILEYATVMYNL